MPELWRNNPRTSRIRDSVPRLLTSLQAMWLLDLREPPEEKPHATTGSNQKGSHQTECHTQDPNPPILQREGSLILGYPVSYREDQLLLNTCRGSRTGQLFRRRSSDDSLIRTGPYSQRETHSATAGFENYVIARRSEKDLQMGT